MYCKNCGDVLNDNQAICVKCGVKVGNGNKFCQNCGKELMPGADVCMNCGVAVNKQQAQQNGGVDGNYLNGKDKTTLAVLAFLLGGLGIHNFMLGETKKGIMKIVLTLCFGIGYILSIVDGVKIISGSYVVDPDKMF